jgi:hypothetical protein
MVAIKIIRLFHLASYVIVTSQLLFYLVILGDAMKVISLNNYFEQRRVIDTLMNKRFRIIYYTCLLLSLLTTVLAARDVTSFFFISTAISFLCVAGDVVIAQKKNVPLNALSNTYAAGNKNQEWETIRTQWLKFIQYRGFLIVIGMIALLIGLVFDSAH